MTVAIFPVPTPVLKGVFTNVDTKGGEQDVRDGKTTACGVEGRDWRGGNPAAYEARCPSLFDVACLESGDLTAHRRGKVLAHARRCLRCAMSLAELSQARGEILGNAPAARSEQAQRAAQHIAQALRMRFH